MVEDDDLLLFEDEDETPSVTRHHESYASRKLLITDDDEDVHLATELAIRNQVFDGCKLEILHAYSSIEAYNILQEQPDIAIILLDVVMESDEAGLELVEKIRLDLKQENIRIILRTGQPGYAPELETISRFDINDYKTKNELTRERLFTALTTAMRSYNQLVRMDHNRKGLARIINSTNSLMLKSGLVEFAEGVISQLAGFIGIEQDGLVCFSSESHVSAQSTESNPSLKVIASAGRYAHWMLKNDSELEPCVWQFVQRCFQQRESIVTDRVTCLYLEPADDSSYVVYLDTPEPVSDVDINLIEMFAHNISLCASNQGLLERLHTMAFDDALTGLKNRNGLIRLIEEAQFNPNSKLGLVLLDVDQFSMLNDTFGVEYGDSLLRLIAQRISGLAEVQFAARLWADQYAFIIDLGQSTLANAIQKITQPVVLNGVRNLLSACAGMAHFATGAEADDLIANATIALKRAKLSGHGSHIVFATDMVEALRARSKMLALLKHDFDQGLFHLEYQPQVRADNQKIIGVEALCRWTNSEGQRIGPDVFIPLAEQSGLILALGEWVLKQALRDLKTLREQEPNLRMAVNVSALQFKDPDFEHILTTSLQEAGLSGNCLDVEITESVGMMGSAEVEAKFARIKQQGVMISIDDFGTGFSSLSYLDQLSADQLKIDRSFVEKLQLGSDSNIAKMIVDLGLMLKLEVLAEGVETEEQLKILAGLGCHYAQGYLFSRPLRLEDLLKWMKV